LRRWRSHVQRYYGTYIIGAQTRVVTYYRQFAYSSYYYYFFFHISYRIYCNIHALLCARSWLTCICQLKSNCSFAQLLPLLESGTIWSRGEQFTEDNSMLRTRQRNPKRLAFMRTARARCRLRCSRMTVVRNRRLSLK
jgi:hypothetical protein